MFDGRKEKRRRTRARQSFSLGARKCATPDFDKVHHVVGAANAMIGDLFGDDALAGRTAVGVAALPERASVVLETVVAVAR